MDLPQQFAGLIVALAAGFFVMASHRAFSKGLPLNRRLNLALAPSAVIIAAILFQSEGQMLPAAVLIAMLAYVYYQRDIRDKAGAAFALWAIATGVAVGLGSFLPVLLLNGLTALTLMLILRWRATRLSHLLIIRCDHAAESSLTPILKPLGGRLVQRFEQNGQIDITLEIRLRHARLSVVDQLAALRGVHKAILISRDDPVCE